ncbi:MAG: hypothetical protein CMB80_09970 [Flammeovirgaceae bacterium]|nr:hypothetical protein [Flammeovirgaceae bacterium]MBR08067.1 hypothetical protein [Rickettsiales bacterium]HCX21466.1 DUF420 domain-containing protein [Cytophagales bacterium]
MEQVLESNKTYLRVIQVVSLVIPIVVAILLFAPFNLALGDQAWVRALPGVNAIINSLTSILLISALIAIKKKNITLHRNLMLSALVLGTLFLVSYVLYHASTTSTVFGDMDHDGVLSEVESAELGSMRGIYLFTLLSHIGLSIVVVPFVLLAFYYALSNQISKHQKIVKYTFPVWLYVSVTGVLVYLMISPYYL